VETEIHGVYDVYATVTRGISPVKDVLVIFRVDGKAVDAPCHTSDKGVAQVELKLNAKLDPRQTDDPDEPEVYHEYTVSANIANTNTSAEDRILVLPKEEKDLTKWQHFMMVAFLVLFVLLGPGTWWLKATFLIATLLIVKILATKRGKTFRYAMWEENNWIFFAVVGMSIVSGLMAYMNPIRPHSFTAFRHPVWAFFNKMYFGKLAGGWSMACKHLLFPWALPFAFVVSFWDNVVEGVQHWRRKKHSESNAKSELITHAKYDTLFAIIIKVLKGIFGFGG